MRYAIKHKLCYITKQPFAVEVKKINSGKWRKKMGKNVSVALKVRQDGQQYDDSRMRKKKCEHKTRITEERCCDWPTKYKYYSTLTNISVYAFINICN